MPFKCITTVVERSSVVCCCVVPLLLRHAGEDNCKDNKAPIHLVGYTSSDYPRSRQARTVETSDLVKIVVRS